MTGPPVRPARRGRMLTPPPTSSPRCSSPPPFSTSSSSYRPRRLFEDDSDEECTRDAWPSPISSPLFSDDSRAISCASHDVSASMSRFVLGRELGLAPRRLMLSRAIPRDPAFHSTHDNVFPFSDAGGMLPFTLAFPRDGHQLAVGTEDGRISLIDASQSNVIEQSSSRTTWTAHANAIFDVQWSSSGTQLAAASGDQTISLWDVSHERRATVFAHHKCTVKSVAFDTVGGSDLMVSGGRDGQAIVYDKRAPDAAVAVIADAAANFAAPPPRRRRRLSVSKTHFNTAMNVSSVAFVGGSRHVAAAGASTGIIQIWDLRNAVGKKARPVSTLNPAAANPSGATRGIVNMAIDENSSRIIATTAASRIYMFDVPALLPTHSPERTFSGPSLRADSFFVRSCFSPDGAHILSGSSDSQLHVWNAAASSDGDAAPTLLQGHAAEASDVAWTRGMLASCSDDGTVRVWHQECA